jgi:hypothetical protein
MQKQDMIPFKIFPADKRRVAMLVAVSVIVLFSMAACANEKPRRITPTPGDPDLAVGKKSLDESTVVRLVQQYVARSGGSVMVRVPYWETRKQKVTCYGDPQFEGCYEDQFSPTGYSKDISRQERQCCQSERRSIPSRAAWEAVYQRTSDEWDVKVEFSLEDAKQLIKWTVDDNSREVSENR